MRWRAVLAGLPFALLVPAFRFVPLPPHHGATTPWEWTVIHAAILAAAFAAHVACYARWQPRAPGRMLLNEALARLWFVTYGILVVGRASPQGLAFLLVGVPWAALAWEVHRQDVRKRGYDPTWNLAAWGLFLLGLTGVELVAIHV